MSAQGACVVVGYDASESARRAVVWAAQDAAQRDRALIVVAAVDYTSLGLRGPASVARWWLHDAREQAALTACEGAELATASATGLDVRPVGRVGRPSRVLVEESSAVQMLVVGTRARGGLAEVALGSVAQSVATLARCPVVLLRPGTAVHPGPEHPVVVGVDGSPAALAAVNAAAARARRRHPFLDVRETEIEGPAAAVLAAQSTHAGLLVVGSRGRGAVQALLLGSVSHDVARSSTCPVAVVGPHAAPAASQPESDAEEEPALEARLS